MKFVDCPHCGMKNLESVAVCKSCKGSISNDGGVTIIDESLLAGVSAAKKEVKTVPAVKTAIDEKNLAPAKTVKAQAPETKDAPKSGDGLTFDDLIEDGLGAEESDKGALEAMEVVRETSEETAVDEDDRLGRKSSSGVQFVKVKEEKEPEGLFSLNFRRNILPRLFSIFFFGSLLLFIIAGIVVYNIMDMPQYYNYFHLRADLTKTFPEALKQLKVFENAKNNVGLKFQLDEITGVIQNKYCKWMIVVSKAEKINDPSGRKNVYRLDVRESFRARENHYLTVCLNEKMLKKLKGQNFKINSEQTVTISGRITGWSRFAGPSLNIDVYDFETL